MDRVGVGDDSCKIMFLDALPINLLRHFCFAFLGNIYAVKSRTGYSIGVYNI